MAGKRRHHSLTRARNARGQFAPAPDVLVISDSDGGRGDLQPPSMGGGNRSSKGKGPMTRARASKKDTDDTHEEDHCSMYAFYTDSDFESTDFSESEEQDQLKWAIQLCKNKSYHTIDHYVEKAKLKAEEYAQRAKNRVSDELDELYDDIMSGKMAPPKAKAKKEKS